MKVAMNEMYDWYGNAWTYVPGVVYEVTAPDNSDFYHMWHGNVLDVIPRSMCHVPGSDELKRLKKPEEEKSLRIPDESPTNPPESPETIPSSPSYDSSASSTPARGKRKRGVKESSLPQSPDKPSSADEKKRSGSRRPARKAAVKKAEKKPKDSPRKKPGTGTRRKRDAEG